MSADPAKSTSLTSIRQAIGQPKESTLPEVSVGFSSLQSFELAQRIGKMFASSDLVPKQYQGNLANCVIALNMAHRIGADPLQVMQNLYVVHGRPSWSSQFLIATFNQSGKFSAIRYEWKGKPGTDDYGCRAWAIEKSTGEKLQGSLITIGLAKKEGWYGKSGSKWQTMPDQMLMYRSASWLVRAYAPELAMGLHTKEEVQDMPEGGEDFYETSVEALRGAGYEPVVGELPVIREEVEVIENKPMLPTPENQTGSAAFQQPMLDPETGELLA